MGLAGSCEDIKKDLESLPSTYFDLVIVDDVLSSSVQECLDYLYLHCSRALKNLGVFISPYEYPQLMEIILLKYASDSQIRKYYSDYLAPDKYFDFIEKEGKSWRCLMRMYGLDHNQKLGDDYEIGGLYVKKENSVFTKRSFDNPPFRTKRDFRKIVPGWGKEFESRGYYPYPV
jgi:hypothetical protein